MKKMLAVLLVLVMVTAMLAGCGAKKDDALSAIQERGYIIVAMEGCWAPWTYHDETDQLVGFDTEVAAAIAQKLGVEVQYAEGEWDGLFAGLDAGRYDIIVNGVDLTEDRAAAYNFTDAYAYIRTALVVRGDNEEIAAFEDLNGKTTVNSIGSTYELLAESYGATVQGVDTLDETLELVLQGRADATLNAEVSIYDYLDQYPDANIKIVALTEEASHVCIPMKKDDSTKTLQEAINKAIAELRADGTLAQLSQKYFGSNITE